MSETPRTDALAERLTPLAEALNAENAKEIIHVVLTEILSHCDKLERELAAVTKERDEKDRQVATLYQSREEAFAKRDSLRQQLAETLVSLEKFKSCYEGADGACQDVVVTISDFTGQPVVDCILSLRQQLAEAKDESEAYLIELAHLRIGKDEAKAKLDGLEHFMLPNGDQLNLTDDTEVMSLANRAYQFAESEAVAAAMRQALSECIQYIQDRGAFKGTQETIDKGLVALATTAGCGLLAQLEEGRKEREELDAGVIGFNQMVDEMDRVENPVQLIKRAAALLATLSDECDLCAAQLAEAQANKERIEVLGVMLNYSSAMEPVQLFVEDGAVILEPPIEYAKEQNVTEAFVAESLRSVIDAARNTNIPR